MSEIRESVTTELGIESKYTNTTLISRFRNSEINRLILCFAGIALLTIGFIYSLQADQILLSNKISAYIIFSAWVFMKTNDSKRSGKGVSQ